MSPLDVLENGKKDSIKAQFQKWRGLRPFENGKLSRDDGSKINKTGGSELTVKIAKPDNLSVFSLFHREKQKLTRFRRGKLSVGPRGKRLFK